MTADHVVGLRGGMHYHEILSVYAGRENPRELAWVDRTARAGADGRYWAIL
jgi:hypothetical protein